MLSSLIKRNPIKLLSMVFAMVPGLASTGAAEVYNLSVLEDVQVKSSEADTNSGAGINLRVYNGYGDIRESFAKFDLSTLGSGDVVLATLRVYARNDGFFYHNSGVFF